MYGSETAEPKNENPKACTDSELVMPVGPLVDATSPGGSAVLPLMLLGGVVAALGVGTGLVIAFRRGKRSA